MASLSSYIAQRSVAQTTAGALTVDDITLYGYVDTGLTAGSFTAVTGSIGGSGTYFYNIVTGATTGTIRLSSYTPIALAKYQFSFTAYSSPANPCYFTVSQGGVALTSSYTLTGSPQTFTGTFTLGSSAASIDIAFTGLSASKTPIWSAFSLLSKTNVTTTISGSGTTTFKNNVGIGISTPTGTLTVYNTTANTTTGPDAADSTSQILIKNGKTGTTPYCMAIGIDQTYGCGYINAAGNTTYQPVCLNTRGGYVGIGTTNPAATLDVNGTLVLANNTGGYSIKTAAGVVNNLLTQDNGNGVRLRGGGATLYINPDTSATQVSVNYNSAVPFAVYNTTNPTLFCTSAGLVGIGTASPYTHLHVGKANSILSIGMSSYAGTAADNTTFGLERSRNSIYFESFRDAISNKVGAKICGINRQTYGDGNNRSAIQSTDIAFFTAPSGSGNYDDCTEKMRIDYAGNVGIGTTNPGYPLQIWGTGGVNSTATLAVTNGANSNNGYGAQVLFQNITGLYNVLVPLGSIACLRENNAANYSAYMQFNLGNQSGSGATYEVMRINSAGCVGIGITNPATQLHVIGNARFGTASNYADIAMYSSSGTVQLTSPTVSFNSYNAGYPPDINTITRNSLGAYYGTRDGVVSRGCAIDLLDVNTNSSFPTGIRGGQIVFYTCSVVAQGYSAVARMIIDPNGTIYFNSYTTNGTLSTANGNGTITVSSDRRIKDNIVYVTDTKAALSQVNHLKPATFTLKGGEGTHLGFIAQDVEEYIPLAVDGKKYEYQWETDENNKPILDENGQLVYKLDMNGDKIIRPRGLTDRAIIATQTLAIQELSKQLTSTQERLADKSAKLDALLIWAMTQGFSM